MNTPNPLLPQGTLPPRGKSNLYFKILMIFAVHIVLLGGILMVGCKDTKVSTAPKDPNTDVAANPGPMSAPTADTSTPPSIGVTAPVLPPPTTGNNGTTVPAPLPLPVPVANITPTTIPTPNPAPTPTATGGSVYVIVAGDMLSTIAKKNGVSVKAIEDANPGLDPKKLQINHKLQIPASTAVASTDSAKASATSDAAAAAPGDGTIYKVKAGDNLGKIAKTYGTTVKALEALNDMKTSALKAGQKLKVPVMKMASADTAPAPIPAPAVSAPAPSAPAPSAPAPAVKMN